MATHATGPLHDMTLDPAAGTHLSYVATMATYNAWMNDKLYAAAARLPEAELMRPRGAFFGSIFGTLCHLVVADTIWLKRFATAPAHAAVLADAATLPMPAGLDERPFADLPAMAARRRALDALIVRWAASLDQDALSSTLHYTSMRGEPHARALFVLLMHFFNHQTHHRGQATTLLTQAGEDVGVTDLVAMPAVP